jgi:AcrR family transcriptional regulator
MGKRAAGGQSRGRPRDATIDLKVLDAARALLVEQGFDATTMQAIAERAGVHASAVYRRWSSKSEVIAQAVFPGLTPAQTKPSGNLEHDLRRFIRAFTSALGSPVARAAMPRLLVSLQSKEAEKTRIDWDAISARPQFIAILDAAGVKPVGDNVDVEDVFDLLQGAIMARVLIPTVSRRQRPVERLVEMVMQLLEPA